MKSIVEASRAMARLGGFGANLDAKLAPGLVAGLAVIGIAWQAARLTSMLFFSGSEFSPSPSSVIPAQPVADRRTVDLQSIVSAHLFGVVQLEQRVDINNLPSTQASLILAGTLALADPKAGFAIVGENAASAKFYRAGDALVGGTRLHSVYVDRVIIDRNGILETLSMPISMLAGATLRHSPAAIADAGDATADDQDAVEHVLRAQPVFSNGDLRGYRVYPGRDRQRFARLGLQPGDLLTSINGATLDQPDESNRALSTLISAPTARVTVLREGVDMQLTLDIGSPSAAENLEGKGSGETGAEGSTPVK